MAEIGKDKEAALTAERLRELLDYDPATGIFRWRVSRGGTARAGTVAGSPQSDGYAQIKIDGPNYMAHRLAWLWGTGSWPAALIDHINGDRADNRFVNLREATLYQNQYNSRISSRNTSGHKGICWHEQIGKWQAYLKFGGKQRHLGYFTNIEDAAAAIEEARHIHHGAFARTRLLSSVDLTGSRLT